MPIYEYICQGCGNAFELLIRSTHDASCPSCGSKQLKRKMSAFGFVTASGFVSSTGSSCAGCTKDSCHSCK